MSDTPAKLKTKVKNKLETLEEQVKDALQDSVSLEISSMIVDGISGRKMPDSKSAFCEVLVAWCKGMITFDAELSKKLGTSPLNDQLRDAIDFIKKNPNADNLIDNEAHQPTPTLIKAYTEQELIKTIVHAVKGKNEQTQNALENWASRLDRRFATMCSLFLRIANDLEEDEELDFKEKQELRKMWELKDGFIYAQNTVQLDGDVVARYNSRLFQDNQLKDRANQLIEMHQNNVATGIRQWQFIFNTISEAIKAISFFK